MRRFTARCLALGALAAFLAGPAPAAAVDCERVLAPQIEQAFGRASAPRVLALHGSVPLVTMEPFAAFLEAMGYPAERLAHPADGARTLSSFVDARRLAGEVAWHYEHDGVMPVLIGHSQGGMVVIKVLHELAGRDGAVPVFDPLARAEQARTWIVEPVSGVRREVTDLRVGFAAALATGSLPRVLLGQWDVLPLLRDVPDSVTDFSGFAIPWDPIAGTFASPAPFRATGSARVHNVVLPASYSHVRLPDVEHLARQRATREWLDAWQPGSAAPLPADANVDNIEHAAVLWHALKRQWCRAGQAATGAVARR